LQTKKFRSTVRPNRRSRTQIGHTLCLLRHSCYVPTCCRSDTVSTLRWKKNHCNKGILHLSTCLTRTARCRAASFAGAGLCFALFRLLLDCFYFRLLFGSFIFQLFCLYGDDVITCADSALRLRTRAWAILGFGDSS